jgi:hypothetical protein
VKNPEEVTLDIERRVKNTWNTNLEAAGGLDWPHTFPLGAPSKANLEKSFHQYQTLSLTLQSWAAQNSLRLTIATRLVMGTTQPLPTHITVDDIDTAARLCGPAWTARLGRGRARLAALRSQGLAGDLTRAIRDIDGYSDLDFELLCSTADWFRRCGQSARGLTPRQVPVPGLQAKWLNSRHRLIATLADLPELSLLPPHPARIHFTYLDPGHRAAGGRWHDSASVGDAMIPAYNPRIVIITENKDTAIGFPPLLGGISVEGAGTGGSTPAAVDWLRTCPTVIYWGDMDADGLTILNQYREAGLAARSILMDIPTYDTYAQFGTNVDVKGKPIKASNRRPLAKLTDTERELYSRLTDPAWSGYRRIEQERVPLAVAAEAVLATVGTPSRAG